MGFSNDLSCEAGSFSCCCPNPHRCFQSEVLRLYFPVLELWATWFVSLPRCSSRFICRQMWDHLVCKPLPCWVHQLQPCHESSPPWLPVSTAPIGLGIPSLSPWLSDFIQFDFLSVLVDFVFKFVVVLLLVVRGGTVCLPTPPSWPEVPWVSFEPDNP